MARALDAGMPAIGRKGEPPLPRAGRRGWAASFRTLQRRFVLVHGVALALEVVEIRRRPILAAGARETEPVTAGGPRTAIGGAAVA